MIKLIVCTDLEGNIGKNNDLLFHIPEDMKFFKKMTNDNYVVMGDKTWDSLPKKPLPNRVNVIASFDDEKLEEIDRGGYEDLVFTYNDFQEIIVDYQIMEDLIDADLFIIGGASIYNQVIEMGVVEEAYVTIVSTVCKDADVAINLDELELLLPKQEIIDDCMYDGKLVTFWKYTK